MRISAVLLLAAVACAAQGPAPANPPPRSPAPPEVKQSAEQPIFICPMDPEVRSKTPGVCPRCGMKLEANIPAPVEYPLQLVVTPRAVRPGTPVHMLFRIVDPKTGKVVTRFNVVHEKQFHLFFVSQDLAYFAHEHPAAHSDGAFRFDAVFPKPGMYRVLSDFYPEGGTPQMIVKTVITAGYTPDPRPAKLAPDLSPKQGENLTAELRLEPPQPIAGKVTLLYFRLSPADGVEPYLGAWGHLLVASDDLIDVIHTHPFLADGGPQVQFNVLFPREATYRLWVQFQRKGQVNTVAFTVPVMALR